MAGESVWYWSGGTVNGKWCRALVGPSEFEATMKDIRRGGRVAVVNVGEPAWKPTSIMLDAALHGR